LLRRELIDNEFIISELWETERMIIRDAELQDVDRLQELYLMSQSTEGWIWADKLTTDYILKGINGGHLPPNGVKEFYKIQTVTHKNSSEIMGFIEIYQGYPDKDVLYIATLLFCEVYRGHRYGQELVNELCKQALELGFHQARLGVTLKNWLGLYFWTKLGFDSILKFCGDKVLAEDSFALLELGKKL